MALIAVLTDREGVVHGEVRDARAQGVAWGLRRPRTARLTVGAGHPLRSALRATSEAVLKVYDEDDQGARALWHHGEVTGYDRQDSDQGLTVQVASTDPSWRLERRLLAKSAVPGNPFDDPFYRTTLLGMIVGACNFGSLAGTVTGEVSSDHTGIVILPGDIEEPATLVTIGKEWYYVTAAAAFAQVASGLDGPDWYIRPIERDAGDPDGIGALVARQVVGELRPDVEFEFGTGRRNVASYQEVIDPLTVCNKAFHLPPGFPDSPLAVIEDDHAGSITARGLHEAVVAGDFTDSNLRDQLVDAHVAVRNQPRQVVTFTLIADPDPAETDPLNREVPRVGYDYDMGDVVTFRAVEHVPVLDGAGTVLRHDEELVVDGLVRIRSIEVADDDLGRRTTTLTVVAE